jgi:serine/threonine-protein kinase
MDVKRWGQIKEIYDRALDLSRDERQVFLAEACAGDDDLRREVESLLAAHEDAGTFLQSPAVEVAARDIVADEVTSPAPQLIGRELANYKIISLLGRGGMGEVYLAEDHRLRRKVALKLLPTQFMDDAERVRRFEREASAASATNHPNIITIYEIGQVDGAHYIVTEFIDGQTLRQRMQTAKLNLNEVVDVAIQVTQALEAAHSARIVHRDIKPENVMARRDGLVKVLDFGLAKLTEQQPSPGNGGIDSQAAPLAKVNTDSGTVMGTASYMSPEQARGQKVDARTDIFSLGVALYEMIAGSPPFEGVNALDVIGAILQKEPAPLSQTAAEAPPELERIVGKALRKDREERYQTASDLLNDLKDLKEELSFAAKQARAGQTERQEIVTAPTDAVATAANAAAPTTSSAQIILGEIKRHKLGVTLVLVMLLAAVSALGYFAFNLRRTSGQIESIAVLPFENASGNAELEYLSDGVSESVLDRLSQLPQLKVIARSSSFRYRGQNLDLKQIAGALGVQAIVTGRVAPRGDGYVIRVDVTDVPENKQVWGENFTCPASDIQILQTDIAREISEKLRLQITSAERQQLAKRPTENLKAFQYYMQGRTHVQRRTREDALAAIRYYEKAITEDSKYARAYAGLAEAYTVLGTRSYLAPLEARQRAEEAARKAVALDENLAEAHVGLAIVYGAFAPYNFQGVQELRRALELNPNLATAHQYLGNMLWLQGRLKEGLEQMLKARELDPLSPIIARQMAIPYYFQRDYGRALEMIRQANELGPAFSMSEEIGPYIQNKLFNESLVELEKVKQNRQNDPLLLYSTGMVYAAQRKRTETLQTIKKLEEMAGGGMGQAHSIAKIYSTLNEKELALQWLERGLTAGTIVMFYKDDPIWDALRNDVGFSNLLQRMNLPQ